LEMVGQALGTTSFQKKNPEHKKHSGLILQVKGGSQLTSFFKTKNPDFDIRVLYSKRESNPILFTEFYELPKALLYMDLMSFY